MTIKKKIEEATVSIIADKRETSSGKYRLYVRVSWQLQTKLFPINAAIPKKFWPHLYTSRVPEVKAGASTEIIQSCLGHTSVTTTQIYLSGFDNSQISKYTDQL